MKINLISQIFPELADEDLGEDDVFVLESIAEAKKNEEDKLRVTLILSLKDSMPALTKVLKIIEVSSTICTQLFETNIELFVGTTARRVILLIK